MSIECIQSFVVIPQKLNNGSRFHTHYSPLPWILLRSCVLLRKTNDCVLFFVGNFFEQHLVSHHEPTSKTQQGQRTRSA